MKCSRVIKMLTTGWRLIQERRIIPGVKSKYGKIIRSRKIRKVQLSAKKGRLLKMRMANDAEMILWPDDAVSIAIYLEEYEVSEITFIHKMLKPGMVFVDVGANIGLYSVIAAKLVGEKGQVYSFEPASETYNRLQLNISHNKCNNVVPLKMAISEDIGVASMKVVGDGYSAWSSLGNTIEGKEVVLQDVQTVSLDSIAHEYNLLGNIDLIKIDVEGWERNVLTGARMVMSESKAPIMMVEFTEENANRNGVSCAELYRFIKECDYELYRYVLESNTLEMLDESDHYYYMNAICVRKGRSLPELH